MKETTQTGMNESRLSTNTLRVHKLLLLQTGNVLQHAVALCLLQVV
jgi:hypothetical protein